MFQKIATFFRECKSFGHSAHCADIDAELGTLPLAQKVGGEHICIDYARAALTALPRPDHYFLSFVQGAEHK